MRFKMKSFPPPNISVFEHSNRNYEIENEGRNYQQVCGLLRDRPAHVWVVLWKDLGTRGCC